MRVAHAQDHDIVASVPYELIADVDVELLKELHSFGSVKNLKDRRKDFFQLRKKTQL